jgi:hypothetical protein
MRHPPLLKAQLPVSDMRYVSSQSAHIGSFVQIFGPYMVGHNYSHFKKRI